MALFNKRLVLILSTHVDDLEGAGEAFYREKLLDRLEKEFSKLKLKEGKFECVGVMHEQGPATSEVVTGASCATDPGDPRRSARPQW